MAKATRHRKKAESSTAPELSQVDLPALVATSFHAAEAHAPRDAMGDLARDREGSKKIDGVETRSRLARSTSPKAHEPVRRQSQAQQARYGLMPWLLERRSRGLGSNGLAVTIATAAICGAIAGSLATIGLAWMRPSDTSVTLVPGELTQKVARIDAEFAALKADVSSGAVGTQSARAEEVGNRPDQQPEHAAIETTGSIPEGVATTSTGALPTVDGWVLRNVYGGAAVVEGRPGLIQVMPGDSLPGVGRIETIRRVDGRWVVVTSAGLIVGR